VTLLREDKEKESLKSFISYSNCATFTSHVQPPAFFQQLIEYSLLPLGGKDAILVGFACHLRQGFHALSLPFLGRKGLCFAPPKPPSKFIPTPRIPRGFF